MEIHLLSSSAELETYRAWMTAQPATTLWQSLEWRRFQQELGRETRIYACVQDEQILASALVIIDRTSLKFCTWDLPRGPLWSDDNAVDHLMKHIVKDAKKDRCLSLYLSPLQELSSIRNPEFAIRNFRISRRHEQPTATRILDLKLSNEELLAQMHPKGRYNIGVAEKHGVRVEQSSDVEAYAELSTKTAARDGFKGPGKRHYKAFLSALPGSFQMLAYNKEEAIAGLLGVTWGSHSYYYYGASSYEHRALMAPYLLQWNAIQFCRERSCETYDLLGIAPPDSGDDHPWRGISSFKEKFGGVVVSYPPEREIVLKPMAKGLLRLKRRVIG